MTERFSATCIDRGEDSRRPEEWAMTERFNVSSKDCDMIVHCNADL